MNFRIPVGDHVNWPNTGQSKTPLSLSLKVFVISQFRYEECYGLMQIPRSLGPNDVVAGDSVDHFKEAVEILIKLTTQLTSTFPSFSPTQQTRAGLAAYDAGVSSIRDKRMLLSLVYIELTSISGFIDVATTFGDFSSDILARAKYFGTVIY